MSSGMGSGAQGWNPAMAMGPMTIGRLLDRIWTILRGNYRLFVKLGVPPTLAMVALYGALIGLMAAIGLFHSPPQAPDPRLFAILFGGAFVITIPMLVVFAVYQAATCEAALAMSRGFTAACGDLYRKVWQKAGRYTGLVLLCWLIVSAPVLVCFAVFGVAGEILSNAGGNSTPGLLFVLLPFMILGYTGAAVYMVWVTLRLGLAFPACVAEDLTAWKAVQRSGRLTVKAKGRMFVVLLVIWAISYAAMMVFEMLAMAVIGIFILIGVGLHMQIQQPLAIAALVVLGIVFMMAICLFSMLMWAAYAISLTVIYEDQVRRIDGLAAMSAGLAGGLG